MVQGTLPLWIDTLICKYKYKLKSFKLKRKLQKINANTQIIG